MRYQKSLRHALQTHRKSTLNCCKPKCTSGAGKRIYAFADLRITENNSLKMNNMLYESVKISLICTICERKEVCIGPIRLAAALYGVAVALLSEKTRTCYPERTSELEGVS